ncbi:MAG: methionyl-tRNA formyltransferase [Steroidobacteraceae bacterium]
MSPLRIVFAGTPDFSVPALDALVSAGHSVVAACCQPDRPAGRGRTIEFGPVKRRALDLGIPVEQPATLRDPAAVSRLAALAPDLMVVVAYGLILPQAVLDVPRLGCLNIHASLLPRWRGAAPIQRALLAGDERTGVVIMKMDAGLDTGPMLLVRETAIGPAETGGELHDRLSRLGAAAVVEAIEGWVSGRLEARAQPGSGVTYAAKIAKHEARIDWSRPAVEIDRQVRAFNPWPVAETRIDDRQLRVWSGGPVAVDVRAAGPGTVLDLGRGRLVVATGDGAYELGRVQLAGRTAVTAAEFANAHDLAGRRLGS